MRGDYVLLYRTTDQFLVRTWLFLMPLLTLLSSRSGITVVAFIKSEN